MGCKMPWWAGSETPPPDKDKIISDLRAEVASLKEERDNLKLQYTNARHSQWSSEVNAIDEIHSLTQQLAAANGRVERVSSALRGVLPFVVTQVIACNGLKCRESVCESCSFEPDVAAQEACDKYAEAQAALSDLPEADKEKS